MRPDSTQSSPRTLNYTNSDGSLYDLDGIKQSIATDNTQANTYSAAALNGALANPGPASLDPPRYASVTTTAAGATYKTGASFPIVFTGTYAGETVTESLLLTQAGGNETIVGNQPFDTIVSIAVPQQDGAGGTFKFGVSGVACKKSNGFHRPYRQLTVNTGAGGSVKVGYGSHSPRWSDTLTFIGGATKAVAPFRVFAVGTTAALDITIYE